jgi:hypothetical protein
MLTTSLLRAQAFDDGKNILSLGFGFPATSTIQNSFDQYKSFIDYKFKNYGTVVFKYEHGLQKYFGVGVNFDYSAASVSYKYDDSNLLRYQVNIKSKVFGFYGRLNAHLPIGDKLDIYGGAGLGYLYKIDNYNDDNPAGSTTSHKTSVLDFDYQLTVGARYMVKDHFGLFAEAGHASTIGQLGITLGF